MPQKPKAASSRKKTQPKKPRRSPPREILGVALIALGVYLFFCVMTKSAGVLGKNVQTVLFGVSGVLTYIVPFFVVLVGLLTIATVNKRPRSGRLVLVLAALALGVVMLQLPIVKDLTYDSYQTFVGDSYDYSLMMSREGRLSGAGALGGALTYPLLLLLGTAGAGIASGAGLVLCVLALTGVSLKAMYDKTAAVVDKGLIKTQEMMGALGSDLSERRQMRAEERALREAEAEERLLEEPQYSPRSPEVPAQRVAAAEPRVAPPRVRDMSREERVQRSGLFKEAAMPVEKRADDQAFEAETVVFAPEAVEDAPPSHPRIVLEGDIFEEDEPLPAPGSLAPLPEPELAAPKAHEPLARLQPAQRASAPKPAALPAPHIDPPPYRFPSVELLGSPPSRRVTSREDMEKNARKVEETLATFGVSATVIGVSRGPAITRYELAPAPGVRVNKIANLQDDLALALAAISVRIEAPIPGKSAVGIEVPNEEVTPVLMREVLDTSDFENAPSKVACVLGKDIAGRSVLMDIARMPHVLIAGQTGSGKSVCINSLVASILYKAKPEEVRLIMIDPKVVELSVYNGIPHLLIPVVTDPKKAAAALQWAVQEMLERYQKFADKGVRDIKGYNQRVLKLADEAKERAAQGIGPAPAAAPAPVSDPDDIDFMLETNSGERLTKLVVQTPVAEPDKPMPQIVIIIDELADLMMVAAGEVEDAICRLAQLARAAGIHLVIATQRPSVNVITGIIKANIPSRIAFAVSSQIDSRTILDMGGAEKLLGHGDMLYFPSGSGKPTRVQGAWVKEEEIQSIVEFIKSHREVEYDPNILEHMNKTDQPAGGEGEDEETEADELLPQAVEMAFDAGEVSVSMLQRRFKVGYARAGRLIDAMESRGIITGYAGSKPRQLTMSREEFNRIYG